MINVVKKDGSKEDFQIDKIHKVVSWAIQGLNAVNLSDIEINTKLNMIDGITTEQIHSVLIDAAANLITEDTPDYQYVAGRLLNYQIRKHVWGGKNPPKLVDLIKKNIDLGYYTKSILDWYSADELNKIDEFINHQQDLEYTYCSVKQLCDKYLIKNQYSKELYETPQFRYIVAALTIFNKYPKKNRLSYIKRIYNYFSKFKINLATPQLAGLGTNNNSYASCNLIEMLDTEKSINATNNAVAKATCAGYGIGVNFGRIRAINSPVKKGTVLHPGVIPFLKITEANTKAWQKNGVRGGSATVNFPIWHYEIENIVQLKNATTGTNDNRVFNLDYAISISKLFYERFLKNEDITLFSPHDVPDLYDAFGTDNFDDLYRKYEKDKNIKIKNVVKARDLFSLLIKERLETGRIYILNIDNANSHSSWREKVNMSNLCMEVLHAIEPIKDINDPDSECGICILSAINWLEISNDEEFEKICDIVVRMLDELIDIQDYFDLAGKNFCHNKRSLGIGITNLAAFLASNKLKYTDSESLDLIDEWMEKQQYYLIKASINLAKEKGVCKKFDSCKYSTGWLPIDKNINLVCDRKPSMNWKELRSDLKEHGMRHTTLTCQMPVESCLKWNTLIKVADGKWMNFHEICEAKGINWRKIETVRTSGWHILKTPMDVQIRDGFKEISGIYYNGYKQTYEIEFENGQKVYATENHKFLTHVGWVKVSNLTTGCGIWEYGKDNPEKIDNPIRIKKITKANFEHTWDIEVPKVHHYIVGNDSMQLICHNSSAAQNATNGIEPARSLMSYKSSKKASVPFLVPNIKSCADDYQLAFDMPDNIGYLNICNVIQRWMDMSMSCNQYFNPLNYEDKKIPYSQIIKEMMHFWKHGGKSLYYLNSEDGNKHFEKEKGCESGACTL